jgi:hypothetical protein
MRTAIQRAKTETSSPHETRGTRALLPQPALPSPGYSGNRATLRRLYQTSPRLQCKLTIGAVNDPFEAEADRVADQRCVDEIHSDSRIRRAMTGFAGAEKAT